MAGMQQTQMRQERSPTGTRAYGRTGGTLAPIETSGGRYGSRPPAYRPNATSNRRYNPTDQNPRGGQALMGARAKMARGGRSPALIRQRERRGREIAQQQVRTLGAKRDPLEGLRGGVQA